MNVKELLHRYGDRFKSKHGKSTSSDQWSAMNAMLGCREGQYGEVALSCNACDWSGSVFNPAGIAPVINVKTIVLLNGWNDSKINCCP